VSFNCIELTERAEKTIAELFVLSKGSCWSVAAAIRRSLILGALTLVCQYASHRIQCVSHNQVRQLKQSKRFNTKIQKMQAEASAPKHVSFDRVTLTKRFKKRPKIKVRKHVKKS